MDAFSTKRKTSHDFLAHGSELARLIADFDWAKTPIGPIESCPAVIKSTLALILRSPIPIVTLWGETGVMIYNDGYARFAGARHPEILGKDVLDAWPRQRIGIVRRWKRLSIAAKRCPCRIWCSHFTVTEWASRPG